MTAQAFLLFVGASLLIAIVPGPNVMLVASRALAHGFRGALPAALGLSVAAAIYLAITVIGLTAMIAAFPRALTVLRMLGACYLVYIGVRMLAAALAHADPAGTPAPPVSRASLFVQGFLTCFSNPKALLYWSAFLPQFVRPGADFAQQMLMLGATGIVLEALVLGAYAALAAAASRLLRSSRKRQRLEMLAGAVLITLGASLGWSTLGTRRAV